MMGEPVGDKAHVAPGNLDTAGLARLDFSLINMWQDGMGTAAEHGLKALRARRSVWMQATVPTRCGVQTVPDRG